MGFDAELSSDFNFTNTTERDVVWKSEITDLGNNFDGTNFVAPVNGLYNLSYSCNMTFETTGANGGFDMQMKKNGVTWKYKYCVRDTFIVGYGNGEVNAIGSYLTNGTVIKATIAGYAGATNKLIGSKTHFSGTLIRELP